MWVIRDAEQQYRMWFRGQSDYSWGLVPSVQRKDGMGKNYEQYISTNFMIHTMRLNPNAPQRYDRASWLTLMQHYGLPTRLLDWSESPLVALYFALSSDEDAKTDAAVWVLNPMRLNKKVGYGEYVPPISYDSLRGDLEGAFSNHDNDDYGLQNRIIACHGVGCDLRMYGILLRSQKVSRKILALLFRLLQRAGGQFKSCPRYKNGIYSIGSCESGNAGEKIHNLAVCRC